MPKRVSEEAISFYIDLSEKYGLDASIEQNEWGDRFVVLPEQEKLGFEMTLGLTNKDEANIGIGEFWSYIFPFDAKRRFLSDIISGLVLGTNSIAEYKQFGRVTKRRIEDEHGRTLYTQIVRFHLPFIPTHRTEIKNERITP